MSVSPTGQATWPLYARRVIEAVARGGDGAAAGGPPPDARSHSGVFVTLHKFGHLRGCMGMLDAGSPIAEAVREAAISAAMHDPRFPPVDWGELPDLRIEVSILSPPQRMCRVEELELGRHGVLVRRAGRRGLFLPQVAVEHQMDRVTFLARCCEEKAGLGPDAWKEAGTEVWLFTTDVFRE